MSAFSKIRNTKTPSSSSVVLSPVIGKRDSAPAAWLFILPRYSVVKLNLKSRNLHFAIFSPVIGDAISHMSASWFVESHVLLPTIVSKEGLTVRLRETCDMSGHNGFRFPTSYDCNIPKTVSFCPDIFASVRNQFSYFGSQNRGSMESPRAEVITLAG